MSRELEALERIRKKLARHYDVEKIYEWSAIEDDFDIIEATLKNYGHLLKIWNCKDSDTMIIQTTKTIHDENNKKLKALEIIKEKRVDMDFLFEEWEEENYEFALENYNDNHGIELTQEEYDLLKEVLCANI